MKTAAVNVSLVIPAYNEEGYIEQCLRSALSQTVPFKEIIVVDNNSTDATAAIVKKIPGVRLLRESRQGVVHARTTGYNAATGDVIARIDADTILPKNWAEQVQHLFTGSTIHAVSGRPIWYDVALPRFASAVEGYLRRTLAYQLRDMLFLYGTNMAIRRSSWLSVRKKLCEKHLMHEDFDLGIHLQECGYQVAYDHQLEVGASARRVDVSFWEFFRYVHMSPHTYAIHRVTNRRNMYPVMFVTLLFYLPARVLYRGYDPVARSFSLARLFARRDSTGRVDPTLYGVDAG